MGRVVMKTCTKCNQNLPLKSFNKNKCNKDNLQYWCKDCVKEYNKNLYATSDNYRSQVNRGSIEYAKRTNYAYQKEYVKTPKGKLAMRKYRQTENGRLSTRNGNRNYRARKRGIVHDFTEDEWQQKLKSTNGICPMCDKNVGIDKLALDHIIPVSKAPVGLVYTIDDVQPLCGSCNSQKGNKIYMIDYSKLNLLPRKDLKKRIINDHTFDLMICRKSKKLYAKVVKFLDGGNPIFTESEVIFLNGL